MNELLGASKNIAIKQDKFKQTNNLSKKYKFKIIFIEGKFTVGSGPSQFAMTKVSTRTNSKNIK